MGAFTCQYGYVHKVCRCPTPHTFVCDTPDEHKPKDTDNGEWIYQKKAEHRCVEPAYSDGVSVGDRWKCNTCGAVWEVLRINFDQREGSKWLTWDNLGVPDPDGMTAKEYFRNTYNGQRDI